MSDTLILDDTDVSGLTMANRVERNTVFMELYGATLKRVAKREHKRAITMTVEDLEQELALFFMSRLNSIAAFTTAGIEGLAVKAARNIMLQARIEYMHFTGAFLYTPDMIEVYLEDAVWQDSSETVDVEGRMDVVAAVKIMPLDVQRSLFRKYALGIEPDNASPERKRIDRAVDQIAHSLNLGLPYVTVPLEEIE